MNGRSSPAMTIFCNVAPDTVRILPSCSTRSLNFGTRNPPATPPRGTSFAIRAFVSGRHQEALMRFSMNSYLLGVGTVVGALAFGFGGGISSHQDRDQGYAHRTKPDRTRRAPGTGGAAGADDGSQGGPGAACRSGAGVHQFLNRPRKFRPPRSRNLFQKQGRSQKQQGRSRQKPLSRSARWMRQGRPSSRLMTR